MTYRLYISSLSPYSIKAAALLGYAGISCRVIREHVVNRYAVLKRLTGKTMVPVLRRGEWAINDSTRIARWADERSERDLTPVRPSYGPICWLLEEFADEWISRWMVFSRWCNERDSRTTSGRIGEELTCGVPVVGRMVGEMASRAIRAQLARGGAREENRRALEQSRDRILQALEAYFEGTEGYLFGGAPTVADFALYGQLEQYRRDPSGGERMEMYPAIGEWLDAVDAMRVPHPVVAMRHGAESDLENLRPLFAEFFGTYWPVIVALHRERHERGAEGDRTVSVELVDGEEFEVTASRYMSGRVEFVVRHLDRLAAHGEQILGPEGLEIGEAVERAVGRLASYGAGAELLEEFEQLAAYA